MRNETRNAGGIGQYLELQFTYENWNNPTQWTISAGNSAPILPMRNWNLMESFWGMGLWAPILPMRNETPLSAVSTAGLEPAPILPMRIETCRNRLSQICPITAPILLWGIETVNKPWGISSVVKAPILPMRNETLRPRCRQGWALLLQSYLWGIETTPRRVLHQKICSSNLTYEELNTTVSAPSDLNNQAPILPLRNWNYYTIILSLGYNSSNLTYENWNSLQAARTAFLILGLQSYLWGIETYMGAAS